MLQHEQSIKDLLIISRMWTHWAMTIVSPWISTFVVFVENMEEPEQTFLRFENIKQILVSSRFSFPMDAFLCWYSNKLFKHSSQHGPASRQQKQKSVCRVQMKGDNFHNMREKRAKCDEGWVLEREEGGRGGGGEKIALTQKSVSLYSVGVSLELSVCLERGRVASVVRQLLLLLPRRIYARLSSYCCCCGCCCRRLSDRSENFGGENRRGRRAMFRRFRVLVSVSAALPVAVSGQGSENLTFNYRGSVETANFLGHLFRTVGQVLNIAPVDRAAEPRPKPDSETKATGPAKNEDQDEEVAPSGPVKKTKVRRRRCLGKIYFQANISLVWASRKR